MRFRILLVAVTAMALLIACGAKSRGRPVEPREVLPGVWRIRLGHPEPQTPLDFREFPAKSALSANDGIQLPFDAAQITFRVTGRGCSVTLPMTKNEHIYGFGLSPNLFDMTGRRVFIRPTDHPENDLGESHAPAPFYASTRGYGVYVDTARYVSFYSGNVQSATGNAGSGAAGGPALSTDELYRTRPVADKNMLVDVPSSHGVDVYVFAGPAMLDAVRRYNMFSGGGCVPPMWGLGIYYRGRTTFTADESTALARSFREQHIPCDVWGLEPGWQTKTYSSSFVWNTKGFPDPDAFIKMMSDMGYQLSVWQHAFTHPTSPIYAELKKWSGDYSVWDGLVPDFATPQARGIMQHQLEAVLFSKGVSAVKLDECDNQPDDAHPWSFPEAATFPSGLDGEQMHSLFGKLYQQTLLTQMRTHNVRSWNLVRNSHALAAPLPFTLYSDTYDHRGYVRALANEGFSGLLWGPEVRDAASEEDLYRRVETTIFSPLAQIDSWYMKLPPWQQMNREKSNNGEPMPDHEEVTAFIRELFNLRMSLVPYLYSAFNQYRLDGTPPIRALVMDWPGDVKTYSVDDEFMFGPSLLVAPMFAGEAARSVYLPRGEWYDFWTHGKISGNQTISVTEPLNRIPIFVRGNTLLPLAKPVEHFTPSTQYEITVQVFGSNPGPFTLFEDDGTSLNFEHGDQNRITLNWDGSNGTQTKTGSYRGLSRYRVAGWEKVGAG